MADLPNINLDAINPGVTPAPPADHVAPPASATPASGEPGAVGQTTLPEAQPIPGAPKVNLDGPPPDHPRFKEVYGNWQDAERKVQDLESQISGLRDMGIQSPQQLEAVVAAAQSYNALEQLIANNPTGFANAVKNVYPDSYQRIAAAFTGAPTTQPSSFTPPDEHIDPLLDTPEARRIRFLENKLNDVTSKLEAKVGEAETFIKSSQQERAAAQEAQVMAAREAQFNSIVGNLCTNINLADTPENAVYRDALLLKTERAIFENPQLRQRVNNGDFSQVTRVFYDVASKYFGKTKPVASTSPAVAPSRTPSTTSSTTPAAPGETPPAGRGEFNQDAGLQSLTNAVGEVLKTGI